MNVDPTASSNGRDSHLNVSMTPMGAPVDAKTTSASRAAFSMTPISGSPEYGAVAMTPETMDTAERVNDLVMKPVDGYDKVDLQVTQDESSLEVAKDIPKYQEGKDYQITGFALSKTEDLYEMKVEINRKEYSITYDVSRFSDDNTLHFLEQFGLTQTQAVTKFGFSNETVIVDKKTGAKIANNCTFIKIPFMKEIRIGARNLNLDRPRKGMEEEMKKQIDRLVHAVSENPGKEVSISNRGTKTPKGDNGHPSLQDQFEILVDGKSIEKPLPTGGDEGIEVSVDDNDEMGGIRVTREKKEEEEETESAHSTVSVTKAGSSRPEVRPRTRKNTDEEEIEAPKKGSRLKNPFKRRKKKLEPLDP